MDLLDQQPEKDKTDSSSSPMPDLEALMNPEHESTNEPQQMKEPEEKITNYGQFDASRQTASTIPVEQTAPLHELPPEIPEEPTPPPPAPPAKKRFPLPKTIVFAAIALLLVTLPVIGYFVNQQSQIADIRNYAAESCAWCAGVDQCFQATGQSGTPVSTNLCATGNCCTGYSNDGGGNPQPTTPPQPTVPSTGCPSGESYCGGCIQACRFTNGGTSCNEWIDQECQQQGCAGDGVFAGTLQCCSGLQLCGNGRCGTSCIAPATSTPVPPSCESVSNQLCATSCSSLYLPGGTGSCPSGQVCCRNPSAPSPTATPNPTTVCSDLSDSLCIGRNYNSSCTTTSTVGATGIPGTCQASSITDGEGKKICSCNGSPPIQNGDECEVLGALTCINGIRHECIKYYPVSEIYFWEEKFPIESCSISCNAASVSSCLGKTIASACSVSTGTGTCQQTSNPDASGNPTCLCSVTATNTPTNPPSGSTNPTQPPSNLCVVDNPSVTDSYITIPSACGETFTLHRYERTADPGTTSSQCVGTSTNHTTQTVGPGTYTPTGSCGTCVQIDVTINGVDYGTAKYMGECSSNPSAICQNIKIYKNGAQLMSNEYNSIQPGDQITFAAVTAPAVSQARFTINNGVPVVTTEKNSAGELYIDYTVPQVTVETQFTVQAEIFSDGQWR